MTGASGVRTCADIVPDFSTPNFWEMFDAWARSDHATAGLAQVVRDRLARGEIRAAHFDLAAFERGGRWCTDELLFGAFPASAPWIVTLRGREVGHELRVASDDLEALGEVMRIAARVAGVAEYREALAALVDDDWLVQLFADACDVRSGRHGAWPAIRRPGIYRREHASLAFRSSTTTIVTDPQCLSGAWTTNGGCYPDGDATGVDGVLITHGHNDHWHIPSLLYTARRAEVPVVVPRVEVNLLSPVDFASTLSRLGQASVTLRWGEATSIGDFVIEALPFYGEQPSRTADGVDPRLRNWGNCYRLTCPEYSAIVLVDSGVDWLGDMVDVLAASARMHGPVDVVLSCSGSFDEVINRGLPMYSFALPIWRLEQAVADRRGGRASSITLGPDGIVAACRASAARYFLPYANGFRGLGLDPGSEAMHSEAAAVDRIARGLARERCGTEAIGWSPGDSVHLTGAGLVVDRMPHAGRGEPTRTGAR